MRQLRTSTIALFIVILLVSSCSGTDEHRVAPSATSLPLQRTGLAVGGDVQSRATDVVQMGITKEQLEVISKVCRDSVDLASADSEGCPMVLRILKLPCVRHGICVRFMKYGDQDVAKFGSGGYIDVVDDRPSSLCAAETGHTCLRVGLQGSTTFNKVLSGITTGPSPSTSDTALTESVTESPTETPPTPSTSDTALTESVTESPTETPPNDLSTSATPTP